jgi:hypothetical protein
MVSSDEPAGLASIEARRHPPRVALLDRQRLVSPPLSTSPPGSCCSIDASVDFFSTRRPAPSRSRNCGPEAVRISQRPEASPWVRKPLLLIRRPESAPGWVRVAPSPGWRCGSSVTRTNAWPRAQAQGDGHKAHDRRRMQVATCASVMVTCASVMVTCHAAKATCHVVKATGHVAKATCHGAKAICHPA